MTRWNILYRGSLTSCNYGCGYCPFAKTNNTAEELRKDAVEVQRFVDWVEKTAINRSLGILFTPWGEAIIHRYYREAMVRLSNMPNVERVSIQTNLSGHLDDLADADTNSLALWATFHPGEVSMDDFVARCEVLNSLNIGYSVGVVGLREHFDAIELLRQRLANDAYLWINYYKCEPNYYTHAEIDRLRAVDPYFHLNGKFYPSQNKPCLAGETSFTVDGDGDIRRCHFIETRLGNIYTDKLGQWLQPRLCNKATCECHIGYVYQPDLRMEALYRDQILERIPILWPELDAEFAGSEENSLDRA